MRWKPGLGQNHNEPCFCHKVVRLWSKSGLRWFVYLYLMFDAYSDKISLKIFFPRIIINFFHADHFPSILITTLSYIPDLDLGILACKGIEGSKLKYEKYERFRLNYFAPRMFTSKLFFPSKPVKTFQIINEKPIK
jgi:hypothetical protein